MSRRHRSVVAVLSGGLTLSLAACAGKDNQLMTNPPPLIEPNDGAKPDDGVPPGAEASAQTGVEEAESDEASPPSRPTSNPPAPPHASADPAEETPSERLPTWEEVESGHPEGATNPPRPVLVILEDGSRCWKEWTGGMRAPTAEVRELGGKVIVDPAATDGTEIRCSRRRVQNILDRKAAAEAVEDAPK